MTYHSTWWDHEIVQKKAQISAVSGRIIEQRVEFKVKKMLRLMIKFIKLYGLISVLQPSLSKDKT